jgi:hypothetical protein
MRKLLPLPPLAVLAACVAAPITPQFVASKMPAAELRAMQTRLVPSDTDNTMRGVIETLQDLGYRITKVESDAHTVSATRRTALRIGLAVQPRSPQDSIVRANATIVAFGREGQVDSAAFYEQDFFAPLAATMARTLSPVSDDGTIPEAVHPVAELNTAAEREAAGKKSAAPKSTSPTGSKP